MDEKTNVLSFVSPSEKQLADEALRLVRLFAAIPRPDHRSQVVQLAEKLAAEATK